MGHLRNDKIYSGNTRLKKSRKAGQKQAPQEFCGVYLLLAEIDNSTVYCIQQQGMYRETSDFEPPIVNFYTAPTAHIAELP